MTLSTKRHFHAMRLALAAGILLVVAGEPLAQTGGFLERTRSGEVLESGGSRATRHRQARMRPLRRGPRDSSRRVAADEYPPETVPRPIDDDARERRPTAEPVRITGKQSPGEVKPILFVEMDESSILQAVLAVGRLTQINLYGKVNHVAFSDFERFRFDYKDGMIFVSPGTKEAALVDWKRVRTDLAVVMDDGRQYHFEFTVVDSSKPSHRVINVNAPPPRRDLTPEEIARVAEEARKVREAREAEEARAAEELRRSREEALARARALPLSARARRGPLEVAVGGPLEIDGRTYVRFAATNLRKAPLPLTVTVGNANGATVPVDLIMPAPAVGPRQTVEGLAVFSTADTNPAVPLSLFVSSPGAKTIEHPLTKEGR
jgi:hypothetical protein